MKNTILLLCGFWAMSSITAQSAIDPKEIKQTPELRMVSDVQIAQWSKSPSITTLSAGVIQQDDSHRFVTKDQIAGWDKSAASKLNLLTTNEVAEDLNKQFVSAADKAKWNANTKIQSSFNLGFTIVNDSSTIRPYVKIPSYNTYDRDRLPVPVPGEWIFIFNTDTKKINFRTSAINWTALWSD